MERKRTNRHKRKRKSKRASRTRWGREGGEKRTIKDHQNGREMERDKEKERERERENAIRRQKQQDRGNADYYVALSSGESTPFYFLRFRRCCMRDAFPGFSCTRGIHPFIWLWTSMVMLLHRYWRSAASHSLSSLSLSFAPLFAWITLLLVSPISTCSLLYLRPHGSRTKSTSKPGGDA